MKTALLAIGDELLFGEVVDTNSARIAARFYAAGFPPLRHLTVGDDEEAIVAALAELAAAHDVVVATGGLGPTSDDRTSAAAAAVSGRPLELHKDALLHLRQVAGRLGGDLPPANEKQALLPRGVELIPNPTGTACGFILPLGGCRLLFLPGVPQEMTRMLDETVVPLLSREEEGLYRTKTLKVFGPSEAEVETLLAGALPPEPGTTVAYCVDCPVIEVKLRAAGSNDRHVTASLAAATEQIRPLLGETLFAEDDETIDTVVARLLKESGLTLSLAESCTGGLLAKRITDVAGSSAYFLDGVVTYANGAKERRLRVPAALLEEKGAVSAEVAVAMAEGSRETAGSDIALAITGIAGPEGGTADKPVGTVFIALADGRGSSARRFTFRGDREEVRTMTAFSALDWLRRRLLKSGESEREGA